MGVSQSPFTREELQNASLGDEVSGPLGMCSPLHPGSGYGRGLWSTIGWGDGDIGGGNNATHGCWWSCCRTMPQFLLPQPSPGKLYWHQLLVSAWLWKKRPLSGIIANLH